MVVPSGRYILWATSLAYTRRGRTPPELAADIVDRGIMLAGGGALVRGISDLISHETGIFVHIAEDPLLCVVNGCGQVLEDWKRLQQVVDTPEFVRTAAGV